MMFRNKLVLLLLACGALVLSSAACSSTSNSASNALPNKSPALESSPPVPTHSSADDGNNVRQAANTSQGPSADIVRATPVRVDVRAGGSSEAELRLQIAEGYHINANPPTDKNLIATELQVTQEDGITVGKPIYPRGAMKQFAFAPRPLSVYEAEAVIRLPLAVASIAPKGEHTLNAKIRVQPCDHQACYPPRTVTTSINVNVN